MYVERIRNQSGRYATLVRQSYREGKRVLKRTICNISKFPPESVDALQRALRGETLVNPDDSFSSPPGLAHGHVAAVLGTLRKLGLHTRIARSSSRVRELVLAMIVARVVHPASKLATASGLDPETAPSSLGELLGLGNVSPHELYAAMDWLLERQPDIERRLARRHLDEHSLVLYDLTSTYMEGTHCELAEPGYSRDRKPGTLQVVFGLLCTEEGCPVAVEVFKGSTADPETVPRQVEKLRKSFGLREIVLVGDRGMLTAARIREDLEGVEGLRWITTLRAPAIRKLIAAGAVTPTLFDASREVAEIRSDDYPGERLIVCRNWWLAAGRRRKREALLAATERELSVIAEATRRKRQPLRGSAAIGMRVGKVINSRKVAKHFRTEIGEDSFSFRRDEERIAAEQRLDGLYIVRSNVEPEQLDTEGTVRAYKSLAKVERAFRCLKSVDLKVRPVHHRLEGRVRAHIFLCMLAYYVEWHMRDKLAPVLFADHEPEAAERERPSPAAPAKRSKAAQDKAARKRTEDDLPVLNFAGLLGELGRMSVNTIRLHEAGKSFRIRSDPTPLQRRSFELLGVSPSFPGL